ncbi:MAG TPA: TonB family protein [Casimicrobiaceae bacterium]
MPHLKVRPQPHLADVSAPQARKHAAAAPASQKVPQAGSPGKDASPARKSARIRVAGALPPARIPPEALASPRGDRLFATALTMSLALHGVVLALHFTPLDPLKLFDNEPPLEVTLVNAKSQTKPSKAELLAQANLDGGGNTVEKRRAKTPLPLPPKETPAKDLSVEAAAPQTPQEATTELLTTLRPGAVATVPPPLDPNERTDSPTANEMMQKTLEAMRLEAQLAKEMDAYQKLPKRRFIGANAEEYRFARYVEDWRLKVERIGNLNYPEAARQMRLYGSLVLAVSIRSDGSLENVEVRKSSGQRVLDAAAVKIVRMSAPFGAFPADIRRDTDILTVARTWTFTKGDELTSN